MTDNQVQKDIKLIDNVLRVRESAMAIAFAEKDTVLYKAAVAGKDDVIAEIIERMIVDLKVTREDLYKELDGDKSIHEHFHTMAHIADTDSRVYVFTGLYDQAKANVDLITSGEVCYPPALKPTEELMENLKKLTAQLEEASA